MWGWLGNPKKVAVYTGAGISERSGIPNLKQLKALLELHRIPRLLLFFKWRAEVVCRHFLWFVQQLETAAPNETHYILNRFQQAYGLKIFTENCDLLHQKAGSQLILRQHFHKYNFLLTGKILLILGVSEDHSGLIAAYRKLNPSGFVIAVCEDQPPEYLTGTDYYISGDLHQVIGELESFWLKEAGEAYGCN